ncbi:MAG: phage protease [Propionibacteriaceae bacterium]|jgi:hypothetical protein|nr:phage protease [Propionibacteriaceae bacterium]
MSFIGSTLPTDVTPRRHRLSTVMIALLAALIVGLIVSAFGWPAATARPHGLPAGILGPTEAVDALTSALAEQDPAPLTLTTVADREAAITAIETRELYGAILLGDQPEVLIDSASGAAPTQALRAIATQLQAQIDSTAFGAVSGQLTAITTALKAGKIPPALSGANPDGGQVSAVQVSPAQPPSAQTPPALSGVKPDGGQVSAVQVSPAQPPAQPVSSTPGPTAQVPTVIVTDVVPLVESDHLGAGLSSMVLPLVLGGLLGGVLISQFVSGRSRQILAVGVFALGAGAAFIGVMQSWLGLIGGAWLLNAGVVALSIGATAAFVLGCSALLGMAGLPLAALITMVVANPISGAAMPPEFLPGPWGSIGQAFVPGAASTLLRSVVYFPRAATWPQWLILSAWTLGGLVLLLLGRHGKSAKPRSQTVSV